MKNILYISLCCLAIITKTHTMQHQGQLCGTIYALRQGAYITNEYTALKKHHDQYIIHWKNNFCGKPKLQNSLGNNQIPIKNTTLTELLDNLGKDVPAAHYNDYGLYVSYFIEILFKEGICQAKCIQKVHEGMCNQGERFRGAEQDYHHVEISTELIENAYKALTLFEEESENFVQRNSIQ